MPKSSVAVICLFISLLVGPVVPSVAAEANYRFTEDWVTPNTGNWRQQLRHLEGRPNIHALEIGSFEGRSALWFLGNILTHATSTMTCVDVFADPAYEARFDHNIQVSTFAKKVRKMKGLSQKVLRQLKPHSYDLIYIDGSHMAVDVLIDAVLSWDLLKPGGIIIFDDYAMGSNVAPQVPSFQRTNPWSRPQIAVDAFLDVFKPYIDLRHKGYQVIVRKRN